MRITMVGRAIGRFFNSVGAELPREYKSIKAVEDFKINGVDVQQKLKEIAASDVNWVNRFWLPEMYLRIRLPLPVNSSPAYVFPKQTFQGEDDKLRYTALLIRGLVEFKDAIDRKSIDRELSTGANKQNMCMVQYDRVLGCYRQPRAEQDVQHVRNKNNRGDEHVTLMSDNQAFLIRTRIKGDLVPAAGVLRQLQEAVRVSANRTKEIVVPIGAASVGDRADAAACWEELLKVEDNAHSLSTVNQSLFVVCLDDGDNNNTIPSAPLEKRSDGVASYSEETLVESGLHLLTGGGSRAHGLNRWYDASIQLVVRSDGLSGLCIEHSAAEGIVIIQMVETALRYMRKHEGNNLVSTMFTTSTPLSYNPRALTWVVSEEARRLMEKQREDFDELHSEMELEALIFDDFGKEAIKGWKVSPDGFIQLAMQLAHYRLHGYLVSTYESASIRRFAEGRVDNIRAATPEALQWVTAMAKSDEPKLWPSSVVSFDLVRRALNVDLEECIRLFRKAAHKQAVVTAENISGLGIDNHLCALSVIASSLGKAEHPLFTDPLWAEALRFPLSTSQVTTSLDLEGSYLCYGAVVRDGYGCAYNIMPNRIIFAPSAFRSNTRTSLAGFKNAIRDALREMKSLLDRE
ncbi:cha-1 [Pristionchus pacificus]|uniref:Choline O-acetyltransferase n=1 Tax=Pristionchus pacificus TaxID=54126 RepID=A0A2A6BY29_PRIPA|nr:cha-1 [Pristionchus pacificus]|eukprot:PDM70815.1 cha-1 [Pristionchus pacificus]